jgi:hypothetical protein
MAWAPSIMMLIIGGIYAVCSLIEFALYFYGETTNGKRRKNAAY